MVYLFKDLILNEDYWWWVMIRAMTEKEMTQLANWSPTSFEGLDNDI